MLDGGVDVVWAYRAISPAEDQPALLRFTFARPPTGERKTLRFYPLPMEPSPGTVVAHAVLGQNLYIFFSDGSCYRLDPPDRPLVAQAADQTYDFLERSLPDSSVPLSLCGDDKHDSLWAVVPANTGEAVRLQELQENIEEPTASDTEEGEKEESPTANAPSGETASVQATGYTLIRYNRSRWLKVCDIPTFFDNHTSCRLSAYGGVCRLVFESGDSPGKLLLASFENGQWSEPTTIEDLPADRLIAVFSTAEALVLVTRDSENKVSAITLSNGKWTQGKPLLLSSGQPLKYDPNTLSIATLGDDLVAALLSTATDTDAETISAGIWATGGGKPVADPSEISLLTAGGDGSSGEDMLTIVTIVIFVIMLVTVLTKRHGSLLLEARVPAGYMLASLPKRLVGFVIDFLLVALFCSPILAPTDMVEQIDLSGDWMEELSYMVMQDPQRVFLWTMVFSAVFVAYATAFETILAATPGKLLLGMRVCSENGQQCSFAAILLRNVLRFELVPQFRPTAILIVLTRNKQRFGDLVARTIVVEKARAARRIHRVGPPSS